MSNEIENFIVGWLSNITSQTVRTDQDLFESGILDSLSFNELLLAVEQEFSVFLDFDSVDDWAALGTIAGLAHAVAQA